LIQVQKLTKRFNGKTALDSVSFEVAKGDILGFLGPNGAGKTTTMRILTAFIPPTSGTALVGGFDVTAQPLEAKKLIGYLPEHVPLYGEMRVREYLKFRAELKGVRRSDLKKNVDRVIDECQLKEVEKRVISQISKGFRQRTGLADALVSQPPILVLDEPTIGLDPSQIRQTRNLIRELGEQRTLILSTHILSEVEQVCNNVLIVNRGKIVGEGTPQDLRRRMAGKAVLKTEIRGRDVGREALEALEGVRSVSVQHAGEIATADITTDRPQGEVEEKLFALCVEKHWVIRSMAREAPSLEDVFVDLIGHEEAAIEEEARKAQEEKMKAEKDREEAEDRPRDKTEDRKDDGKGGAS